MTFLNQHPSPLSFFFLLGTGAKFSLSTCFSLAFKSLGLASVISPIFYLFIFVLGSPERLSHLPRVAQRAK